MAKQIGENCTTGTFDDICFYKMNGQYYARMKSSLTRERVRKSIAFVRTMKSANELATASVMASQIYRTIAKNKRKVLWYRKMTGMAKLLLQKGVGKEEITRQLSEYIGVIMQPAIAVCKKKTIKTFGSSLRVKTLKQIHFVKSFRESPTQYQRGVLRNYSSLWLQNVFDPDNGIGMLLEY